MSHVLKVVLRVSSKSIIPIGVRQSGPKILCLILSFNQTDFAFFDEHLDFISKTFINCNRWHCQINLTKLIDLKMRK